MNSFLCLKKISPLVFLFLSGCFVTSAGKDYKIPDPTNIGVLAYSNELLGSSSVAYIRRIDLEKNVFVGPAIKFSTCAGCLPVPNTFTFDEHFFSKFFALELEAGTYAFIDMWQSTYAYYNFCRGTPAFTIEAGKINVVMQNIAENSNPKHVEELKQDVAKYSNSSNEVVAAIIPAVLTFDKVDNKGNRCSGHNFVTNFTPIPVDKFIKQKPNSL